MLNVMLFGGCNLRGPFIRLKSEARRQPETAADWAKVPEGVSFTGVPFMTYTVGEMLQAVDLYQARKYLSAEIKSLAGIPSDFSPNPRVGIKNIDVILIEPNTSIEIVFQDCYLNRNRVMEFIVPIRKISPEMDKFAGRWYQKGICGSDDTLKSEMAEVIIAKLPVDYPNLHFTAVFLRSARGVKRAMRPSFEEFLSKVDVPVGLVTYTWRYMPDGRPVHWPADFAKDVRSAGVALNLPIFEASGLIEQHGVTRAMRGDLRHYTEGFQPIMAHGLVSFVKELSQGPAAHVHLASGTAA